MSIEPHTSPTVEAVASLQKEAERVKPGNHVEQVKTESETLETVATFGGLPMGDLIARPRSFQGAAGACRRLFDGPR